MAFDVQLTSLAVWRTCLLGAVLASTLGGCASTERPFANTPVVWLDDDRHPFGDPPKEYYSGLAWDGADQLFFRPLSHSFLLENPGEALNVNAWDEVPDSSWFTNRIGRYEMSHEQLAMGSCTQPEANPEEEWTVIGAKPNGANPGFIIKTASGQRYLLKFDGVVQGPRASAADVIGSRIYNAAGFFTPCNRIVFFDPAILRIDPEAKGENSAGRKVPLAQEHIDEVLSKGIRLPDGRYRANSSLFIEGKPLGPWKYQGKRAKDPNDAIPHQDRREVRAMKVLGAWTNHTDAREQNTLSAWMDAGGGRGYVRHYMIDFGDCFSAIWEPPALGRRLGYSNYFDFGHVPADFLTLGTIRRPWDEARFGPSGPVFGYYDTVLFDADKWRTGYPNPAFDRMTDRDAAWMARILGEFGDEQVRTMVRQGMLPPELEDELIRILMGRRYKLLREYLGRVSPLAYPVMTELDGKHVLCFEDLELRHETVMRRDRRYGSRMSVDGVALPVAPLVFPEQDWVCHELPAAQRGQYIELELHTGYRSTRRPTWLAAHLYATDQGYSLAGIVRN